MRKRNMWISESGGERDPSTPSTQDQEAEVAAQSELPEESMINSPLALSELSLDELVPRAWKRW